MKPYRLFARLIAYRPRVNLLAGVLWFILNYLQAIPALLTREFFNRLTGETQVTLNLWSIVLLFVITWVVRHWLYVGGVFVTETGAFTAVSLLQHNLLERIFQRPGALSLPPNISSGEAISRFRDDTDEIEDVLSLLPDFIGIALFQIYILVVMASINATVTLLVALPIVGVVVITRLARTSVRKYRLASRAATGQVTNAIAEMFNGVLAIQVANAEDAVVANFRKFNDERRRHTLKDYVFNEALNTTFGSAAELGLGLVLLFAGGSMALGRFTVGDFALFSYFIPYLVEFTFMVGVLLSRYQQCGVSFERMAALLQGAPPETMAKSAPVHLTRPAPPLPPVVKTEAPQLQTLSARGLTYHHPDTGRGVENVSFNLRCGQFVVITGRIGSGKTTLLRVLLGLLPKAAGEIHWNGESVDDPASFFVPPRAAYTSQVPRLFSESLRDNLLMGLSEFRVDLPAALRAAALETDVAAMSAGLDTVVGPRGVRLSGGQIQRAAAARMFVREPELLVFDDLSSALDVETEKTLWERLDGRMTDASGRSAVVGRPSREAFTCLVVSHRRPALHRADHILVLKNGRVEAEGALADLLETCEEMQRLWHGEFDKEDALNGSD